MVLRAPKRAYEEVASELEVLIRSGHFEIDERLPSERQLAAEFGVSRPTIRVALGHLEARGFVVTRANSGTFVAARTVETIDVSRDEDPAEVMEARLVLEVAAARLAARRAATQPEALEEVRLALEAHERITDPETLHPQTDAAFHRAIAALTGNAYLCELLEPIWQTIDQNLGKTLLRRRWSRETFERALSEHRAIYEALRAGDPDLALFATETHLRSLLALMFETQDPLPLGRHLVIIWAIGPYQTPATLRDLLAEPNRFVVGAELVTSRGVHTSGDKVMSYAHELAEVGQVDVFSITDNAGGNRWPHRTRSPPISSSAAAR